MFSCKYCEISKNTYFEEHLRTAASEFSFIPIPDDKSLLKVSLNGFGKIFYFICDNFEQFYQKRAIIGFLHMKMLV